MKHTDDRALVARILNGDEDAGDVFARRWSGPCFAIAYSIVRQVEDAQDITQDSLIKALCQLGQLNDLDAAGPWVQAIARNTALKHLARRRRQGIPVSIDAVAPIPAPERCGSIDAEPLVHALACLEGSERAVILHAIEGRRHDEIARELGISPGYSRQILFQARRKLRASLQVKLSP
jgi:RNA polymerase sigma-70 factor (ECF subfamily)